MVEKLKNQKVVSISIIFYIIMVVFNTMGAKGIINGMSQKDVSASFPTMITPAGYAFAIWGVIYTLMMVSFLVLLFKSEEKDNAKIIKQTSVLFWVSSIINVLWTVVFSYKLMGLAMLLIILLFMVLLLILKKLVFMDRNRKNLYDIVFGLYAGWLFVASFVNIVAFLVSMDFKFFGNEILFYSVLLVIAIVSSMGLYRIHRNPLFYLSNAWAYFAISKARGFESFTDPMFLILSLGVVVSIAFAITGFRETKYKL